MKNTPEKCFITDEITENLRDSIDDIHYQVTFAGQVLQFAFKNYHSNSHLVEVNKYILKGLIINNKFPFLKEREVYNNEKLELIIREADIPRSPRDKLDNLLMYLHSLMGYEGQNIEYGRFIPKELMFLKLYFKNFKEYFFYLSTLRDQGLLTFNEIITNGGIGASDIKITYDGLIKVVSLQEDGKLSKNCFVAMSFSESMVNVRNSIKEAVIECNYKPIIVDEIPIESDVTINDAIIVNLKRSKFVIADFTEQKAGVYFESGFALGQGKQVIYLCSNKDFENLHFDTNHYPYIKYDDEIDLKDKLIKRIQAWID